MEFQRIYEELKNVTTDKINKQNQQLYRYQVINYKILYNLVANYR